MEAGLDGIINKIEAPAPIETNIYSMSPEERKEAGIIDLPSTLRNALKALETDEVVRQALGNHIYTNFLDAETFGVGKLCYFRFHNGKLITT